MSDQPETLSAILAEMRKSAKDSYAEKTAKRLEDNEATGTRDALDIKDAIQCLRDDDKYLLDLASRIEAAAERERVKARHDAEIEWTRIGYDERKAEERPVNASAMREALTAFVDSIQWLCDGDERGIFKKQFAPLLSDARAALSAPAMNCDRYATAKDARAAFEAEHSRGIVRNLYTATFDWLFATAEGGDHA